MGAEARNFTIVFAVTLIGMVFVQAPQIYEPFVRHDDFPALLGDPGGFYSKTLEEGRWLNYWWHLRPVLFPAPVNYLFYFLAWVVFCAAAALNAVGRSGPVWYAAVLSLLISLAPQAIHISGWFNTLVPGIWVVASFALLSLFLGPKHLRLLLLIFVPVSLMAYSTYPLLLLTICLTSAEARRSVYDLSGLIVLFALSIALGLLVIYSLNYMEHGIFGIPLAEWRMPTPATDLASALANLSKVGPWLIGVIDSMSFITFTSKLIAAVPASLLLCGAVLLWHEDRALFLYIVTGCVVGLGLLALQIVMSGVVIPFRATSFLWILLCVAAVRAALLLRVHHPISASVARIVLMILILFSAANVTYYYWSFTDWQRATRQLAERVEDLPGPVYVYGHYEGLDGALRAFVQRPRGLRLRLKYLTGHDVILCQETPDRCEGLTPGFDPGDWVVAPLVEVGDSGTYVLLPMVDYAP